MHLESTAEITLQIPLVYEFKTSKKKTERGELAWVKEEKGKTIYLLRRRETEASERNPCPLMSHLLLYISVCLSVSLSRSFSLFPSLGLSLSF